VPRPQTPFAPRPALGLDWHDIEGVKWHLDPEGDQPVTPLTDTGAERAALTDALTGALRARIAAVRLM
jgi:hypothetical protein